MTNTPLQSFRASVVGGFLLLLVSSSWLWAQSPFPEPPPASLPLEANSPNGAMRLPVTEEANRPHRAVQYIAAPPPGANETSQDLLPELLDSASPQYDSVREPLGLHERVEALEQKAAKLPSAKLTGLFQLDTGYFNQDAESFDTLLDPFPGVPGAQPGIPGGNIPNVADFRRARLAAMGSVSKNVNYMVEMDFAFPGRPSFMDVWGELIEMPTVGNVRIGHFRQPFSMTAMNSVRTLPFLERPLPFIAFVPFRRIGVMAYDQSADLNTTWAYSVARANADPYGGDLGDENGAAFFSRATHLLSYHESSGSLLHIGGSYAFSAPTNNAHRFAAVPEFAGFQQAPPGTTISSTPLLVDTGALALNHFHLAGVELAGSSGSFWFQSEYMRVFADQTAGPSLDFGGFYAQAGYFLTGESRPYSRTAGVFDRVAPFENFYAINRGICGPGAWEVAARYSYLDLNDANVLGGRLQDFTAGLNWYWNPYTKLQFNYIHAFLNNPFHGDSNLDILAARFHVDF